MCKKMDAGVIMENTYTMHSQAYLAIIYYLNQHWYQGMHK